jgi:hypothetical protein
MRRFGLLAWWTSYHQRLRQRAAESDPRTRWMEIRLVTWPALVPIFVMLPLAYLARDSDFVRAAVAIPLGCVSIALLVHLVWFYLREGRLADLRRQHDGSHQPK